MAAELVTPTDELTGLPLPIAPAETLTDPDWHHHFHPRLSPRLVNKEGGPALRSVRLQRVDYATHHYGYHGVFAGPPLPKKMKDRFGLIIMSAAGYMPDQALDFSGDSPVIVPLDEEQRLFLQTSGQMRISGPATVRNFIQNYVMSQEVEDLNINERTIEEFVYTADEDRRRLLGHTLLGLITDKATEQVGQSYNHARRHHQISPGLPGSARRFTKALLGPPRSRDRLVNKLHTRLITATS